MRGRAWSWRAHETPKGRRKGETRVGSTEGEGSVTRMERESERKGRWGGEEGDTGGEGWGG